MADRIWPSTSSSRFTGPGNQYQHIHIEGGKAQLGDTYILPPLAPPLPPSYRLGLNLGDAPQIDERLFVGREEELAQLYEWLSPSKERQNVVAISGLGGMGKTQLSLYFARQHHQRYSAVFWLNASSEITLKAAYVSLAQRIRRHNRQSEVGQGEVEEQMNEEQAIQLVRQWLSQPENKTWLLMLDNYDDPRLPNIRSSTGYDIRTFFPDSTQGSILITTRSSRITFGKQVHLKKFNDLNQSLIVLARRSDRPTQGDAHAKKLAERFDGLPLALATAGDYICQTADSFDDYLQMYEQSWKDLAENSDNLMEYDDRTLYSTWNLSLKQVATRDPGAAELFRLMGYLGNADLWYELFGEGAGSAPDWLCKITKSRARFNKAIKILHDYSLIEAVMGHYSIHACVHDWILEHLIGKFDIALFGLAMHCIAQNVARYPGSEFWLLNSRLNHHTLRIEHCQWRVVIDWNDIDSDDIFWIGHLNNMMDRLKEAEAMFIRALGGYLKAWGNKYTWALTTMNTLGSIYNRQGKKAEAEETYIRALKVHEKVLGAEHPLTLDTVNSLGNFYEDQGKLAEAEAMLVRALKGKEKVYGAEHTSTLDTVIYLGVLYKHQGKMAEAEAMLVRALKNKEKVCGAEHPSTVVTVDSLAALYYSQGKMAEAEAMLVRGLRGGEKIWGSGHVSKFVILSNLGTLYADQDKMAEAEVMYMRALEGFEKIYGSNHPRVLRVKFDLILLRSVGK